MKRSEPEFIVQFTPFYAMLRQQQVKSGRLVNNLKCGDVLCSFESCVTILGLDLTKAYLRICSLLLRSYIFNNILDWDFHIMVRLNYQHCFPGTVFSLRFLYRIWRLLNVPILPSYSVKRCGSIISNINHISFYVLHYVHLWETNLFLRCSRVKL